MSMCMSQNYFFSKMTQLFSIFRRMDFLVSKEGLLRSTEEASRTEQYKDQSITKLNISSDCQTELPIALA